MDDSYYYYCLGMDYLDKGNVDEALALFETSLSLLQHYKTYERLAECYYKLGDIVQYESCIVAAFSLNSKSNSIAVKYAEIIATRSPNDAIMVLNDVLLRTPSYGPALKLKKKLVSC